MKDILKIRFFGDFTTGENYQLKYENETKENALRQFGYDFMLEGIKEFFVDSYNIINLESPVTNAKKSALENKKAVIHWMDPKVAPQFLKKNFVSACSLGNNHCFDYGEEGLYQTIKSLEENNIKYFGAGLNEQSARKPLIKTFNIGNKTLNFYVFGGYKYRKDYDVEFDFYAKENKAGVFLLTENSVTKDIQQIKEQDPNSIVVVFPHFGFDLQKKVMDQVTCAHSFIDAGADYVIGTGPHIMQDIEYYKGKKIVYSLGNSVFLADFRGRAIPYNLIFELEIREEQGSLKKIEKLYPVFIDNNSKAPVTRPVKETEIDDVILNLTNNSNEIKEKINLIKGRISCIQI